MGDRETCRECRGTGVWMDAGAYETCALCRGRGWLHGKSADGLYSCYLCAGTGRVPIAPAEQNDVPPNPEGGLP